jgi:hypothetical protein
MATHKVGGEVDSFCTKCKLHLAHTVLAMVGIKIVRVRCNTCGGDHAFRSTPSRTRAPSQTRGSHERVVISFEQLLAGKDVAHAAKYSPKAAYGLDQIIDHPTFGLGIVSAVREDKVDVVFKADQKTLVHGRGESAAPRPAFHPPTPLPYAPTDRPQAPGDPVTHPPVPQEDTASGDGDEL